MNKTSAQEAYANFVKIGLSWNKLYRSKASLRPKIMQTSTKKELSDMNLTDRAEQIVADRAPRVKRILDSFDKTINRPGIPYEYKSMIQDDPNMSGKFSRGYKRMAERGWEQSE